MSNEWKRKYGHLVPLVMIVSLIVLFFSCSEMRGYELVADDKGARIERSPYYK